MERQFTLDLEFVASFIGHALIIFFIVVFLACPNAMWRWIGLPVAKKRREKINK